MPRCISVLLLLAVACAAPAGAEVFRCVGAAGRTRFVDRPSACPGAIPHELRGRIERVGPALPSAPGGPWSSTLPPATARGSGPTPDDVLLVADELAIGFDAVPETAVDSDADPDLVGWGVSARRTRHYTRSQGPEVQVCSVEVWRFTSEESARWAATQIAYPGWQIDRDGWLLLMVRGMTRAPGQPAQRAVFPDCGRLGARIRASEVWGAAPTS